MKTIYKGEFIKILFDEIYSTFFIEVENTMTGFNDVNDWLELEKIMLYAKKLKGGIK